MNDYIPHLLIAFFIISNSVAFYNIYKNRLRYLNPSKGYLFSLLLIVVFVSLDYSVYSFATTSPVSKEKSSYTRFYVENTLNKLADTNILEQDKDVLVEDLKQLFSLQTGQVSIQYQEDLNTVSALESSSQLSIDAYLQQLRISKTSNVIKVRNLRTNTLGQIDFIQVSM